MPFSGNYNLPEDSKDLNLLEPSNPDSQQYVQDKCQTDKLDKEAQEYYTSFALKVTELLQRRGINVDVLILAYSHLDVKNVEVPCDVREANSIASLVKAIQKYQTWYNYGIFAFFATRFGGKEGEELLESYEGQLKHNVEQRITTQELHKKTSKLVVKVDYEKYTCQDIIVFRNMLARVLKRDCYEFELIPHWLSKPGFTSAPAKDEVREEGADDEGNVAIYLQYTATYWNEVEF